MSELRLRLALPKLFLWNEAERFQEYPAGLSRAEEGRLYTRLEVERDLFGIDPSLRYANGRPRGRRIDGLYNLYGLEALGSRLCIRGMGLLERQAGGVRVTEEGLRLGQAYRADRNGEEWIALLIRQVLMREPRTRLLIGLACSPGYHLRTNVRGGRFSGPLFIVPPNGNAIAIEQRNCHAFNQLLQDHAELALGPVWADTLKLRTGFDFNITWQGVAATQPSTNDLPTALKKALVPMLHSGLLVGGAGEWNVDVHQLRSRVGDDVASSLGLELERASALFTQEEALTLAYQELAEPGGFVVVSKLADRFGELCGLQTEARAVALDKFVRTAMYEERLRLVGRHPGQASMGRGLFDEPDSRKVRLGFDFSNKCQPARQASKENARSGGET
jgi:hypothetical protein